MTSTPTVHVEKFHSKEFNVDGLFFSIKDAEKLETSCHKRQTIWFVDVSASMGGALPKLCDQLAQLYNEMETKPTVYTFAEETRLHLKDGQPWKNPKLKTRTDFVIAYNVLMGHIEDLKMYQCNVLFFTDGDDTVNSNHVFESCVHKQLIPFLKTYNVYLHFVGYTRQHDVKMIGDIIRGHDNTTYSYAPNSNNFEDALGDFAQTMSFKNVIKNIEYPGLVYKNITLSSNEPQCVLPVADVESSTIHIEFINGRKDSFDIVDFRQDEPKFVWLAHYLSFLCLNAIKEKSYDSVPDLQAFCDKLSGKLFSLPRSVRKEALSDIFPFIYESLHFLWKTKVNAKNSFDDEAANLSYQSMVRIGKRGLANRYNKRIDQNKDLRSELSKEIQSTVSKQNWSVEPQNANEFSCLLSTLNWWDAIKDNDCMCLTFIVSRPEECVAVSDLLVIKQVNLQTITFNTFEETVQLKGLSDFQNAIGQFTTKNNRSSVHPLLINDARNVIQECNAIVPLYISQDHWKIAKLYFPLAMGWTFAFDERAYKKDQCHILPLLLLEKLHETPLEDRKDQWNTMCEQICLLCDENPLPQGDDYIDKLKRGTLTRSECSNLRVLVGYLWYKTMRDKNFKIDHHLAFVYLCELARRMFRTEDVRNRITTMESICKDSLLWSHFAQSNIALIEEDDLDTLIPHSSEFLRNQLVDSFHLENLKDSALKWSLIPTSFSKEELQYIWIWAWSNVLNENPLYQVVHESDLNSLMNTMLNSVSQRLLESQSKLSAKEKEIAQVARWLKSPFKPWKFDKHPYEKTTIGIMIRKSRHAPVGSVLDAKKKLDFLIEEASWSPARRSRTAFTKHCSRV